MTNAIEFAFDKLAPGRYKLIIEDDRCQPRDAVTVARKLVNIDKVRYVLGSSCSGATLATAPIYEKAQVLVITPSASAPDISEAGDYIFRTWPSDVEAAKLLKHHIASAHKRLGIISQQTDYAQGFVTSLQQAAAEPGLILLNENYIGTENDYRSMLLRLKSRGIDSLLINSQSEQTFVPILRQARELDITVPVFAIYHPGNNSFLKLAGNEAEGIVFVDVPTAATAFNDEGKRYFAEFKERYGEPKSWEFVFGMSFEAVRALNEAISSKQTPKDYLYKTTFHGIFGDWHFDEKGDIKGISFVLKVIRDGRPELLK